MPGKKFDYDQVARRVIRYCEENYSQELSLTKLVEVSGVKSRFHLNKIFKQVTGTSIMQHVHKVRMYHARRMLATTNLKISEVIYSAGFQSVGTFNEMFRKDFKCTPTEYRARFRNKDVA